MVKNHLSKLAMPRTWPVNRKGEKFIIRPKSPHAFEACIPLGVVLRNILKYAKTTKESKMILNTGDVLVNKKVRKDIKLGVGIMDVIEFPKLKAQFRILLNRQGKFIMHPIDAKEANIRPYKIKDKKILKGNKIQLNLEGGENMLIKDDKFKPGDTLIMDTEKKAVHDHLKLEKGATVYITAGNKVSSVGKVDSLKQLKGGRSNIIFVVDNKNVETNKDYALVLGKDKPIISLPK